MPVQTFICFTMYIWWSILTACVCCFCLYLPVFFVRFFFILIFLYSNIVIFTVSCFPCYLMAFDCQELKGLPTYLLILCPLQRIHWNSCSTTDMLGTLLIGSTWLARFHHDLIENLSSVFTAQRYAKRNICRRRVSVCVSVCHTPVKWIKIETSYLVYR